MQWFGGPRLTAILASRPAGLASVVSAGLENRGSTSQPSEPATLYDLRVAATDDVMWVPLTHIRSARAQIFSSEKNPYVH